VPGGRNVWQHRRPIRQWRWSESVAFVGEVRLNRHDLSDLTRFDGRSGVLHRRKVTLPCLCVCSHQNLRGTSVRGEWTIKRKGGKSHRPHPLQQEEILRLGRSVHPAGLLGRGRERLLANAVFAPCDHFHRGLVRTAQQADRDWTNKCRDIAPASASSVCSQWSAVFVPM
jgi:hypothetical protein